MEAVIGGRGEGDSGRVGEGRRERGEFGNLGFVGFDFKISEVEVLGRRKLDLRFTIWDLGFVSGILLQ